jgi:hypothetical protein
MDIQVNWIILWVDLAYWVLLNKHFGWNGYPKSDNELLADGLSFVIFALAFVK